MLFVIPLFDIGYWNTDDPFFTGGLETISRMYSDPEVPSDWPTELKFEYATRTRRRALLAISMVLAVMGSVQAALHRATTSVNHTADTVPISRSPSCSEFSFAEFYDLELAHGVVNAPDTTFIYCPGGTASRRRDSMRRTVRSERPDE
eukprot:scaffold2903_cov336-Prasinococcus_capsulatus_cf.AAC.6